MTESQQRRLCPPALRDGIWHKCGLVVLERHPSGPEACPSYGGGGMFVCHNCMDAVADLLRRTYDTRAVGMEHHVKEDHGFEPLP